MTFIRSTAQRGAAMVIAALICLAGLTSAAAQTYPYRVIKILVPYAAGGNVDFVARVVAQNLTEVLGQSVIIENKPGGSTNLAADQVARAHVKVLPHCTLLVWSFMQLLKQVERFHNYH